MLRKEDIKVGMLLRHSDYYCRRFEGKLGAQVADRVYIVTGVGDDRFIMFGVRADQGSCFDLFVSLNNYSEVT
jgi:hypothetical protein